MSHTDKSGMHYWKLGMSGLINVYCVAVYFAQILYSQFAYEDKKYENLNLRNLWHEWPLTYTAWPLTRQVKALQYVWLLRHDFRTERPSIYTCMIQVDCYPHRLALPWPRFKKSWHRSPGGRGQYLSVKIRKYIRKFAPRNIPTIRYVKMSQLCVCVCVH